MLQSLRRFFVRNDDGSWTCIEATTVVHPRGRIQVTEGSRFYPGTNFMGVDLASWLDLITQGQQQAGS